MVRRRLYEALRAESDSGPPEQCPPSGTDAPLGHSVVEFSFVEIRIRGILRWSRNEALGASRGGGGAKEQEKNFSPGESAQPIDKA